MVTFEYEVLPLLVVAATLAVLVILYWGQSKTAPVWVPKTAFVIRRIFLVLFALGGLMLLLGVVLPLAVQEGSIWLAPESKFGYATKYKIADDKVYVQPKPHDCEWGKAPIGNKYCHFDRVITMDKNVQGKVTAVYIEWNKVQD